LPKFFLVGSAGKSRHHFEQRSQRKQRKTTARSSSVRKKASRPIERPAPKKIEKREIEAKAVAQVVQQRPVKGGYTVDITHDVARAIERSKFGPAIRAREAETKSAPTNEQIIRFPNRPRPRPPSRPYNPIQIQKEDAAVKEQKKETKQLIKESSDLNSQEKDLIKKAGLVGVGKPKVSISKPDSTIQTEQKVAEVSSSSGRDTGWDLIGRVPSSKDPSKTYEIKINRNTGKLGCSCHRYKFSGMQSCKHTEEYQKNPEAYKVR